ncbi:Innexin inx1 [Eumeta japonica]|uniref:Innexin n=1 Tax=Eumeta variegata TaxID=151549 RepID=A0A4C1TTV8_EUMVA|nr:Innexin inx1 [Eumeta japonica]
MMFDMIFDLQRHKSYAFRYWACELLCLINIVTQLWMMDSFFNGEFFSYGTRVLGYSEVPQEERYDPMIYVFPRVTKCTFHKYGASGTIQTHDSLCILPLNIVNEKTYIFIWFWYIILALVLCLLVLYRWVLIVADAVSTSAPRGPRRLVVLVQFVARNKFVKWPKVTQNQSAWASNSLFYNLNATRSQLSHDCSYYNLR